MYPKSFATTNQNKVKEASDILGISLEQIEVDLLEPQSLRVEDVVRVKAEDAFRQTGKVVLVEDTGLEIDAWNGFPGALIRWCLDAMGNEGVLKMLANENDRCAVAKTAVGFFDGTKVHIFTGEVTGHIPLECRGEHGFGWDPIFIPDGHTKSFAEMSSFEKNTVSMRRRALESMKSQMS